MPACVPTTGSLEDYTMKTVAPAGARTPRRHLSQVLGASWVLMCSLASLLPCLAQPNAVRDGKPDFTRVRKFIQEQIVATTVPSVAVAVARRGEILWEEGFGWADRENRVPATEHTMYETASLTKSFTATAIMLLAEQKKLDLDRPANDYLGAARLTSPKWDPAGATVRRLLTHTAGLTSFDDHRFPPGETIRRYGTIFWRPGERFDYSNLGYVTLGEVISHISGKSYADFFRDEVFWPLGMTHASIGTAPGLEKHIAVIYPWESARIDRHEPLTPGANGALCSAHDLVRFGMFHLKAHLADQKAILSDAAIDAMQHSTVTGDGDGDRQRYGLGWWVDEDRYGYRSVLGEGGWSGAAATLRLIPSEGIAVAVLANRGAALTETVADQILSTLLPSYGERQAKDSGRQKPRPPDPPLPAALTGKWTGRVQTYQGSHDLTLSFVAPGDVHVRLGSQLETLLSGVRYDGRELSGRMSGDPGTGELNGDVKLSLALEGGLLYGAADTTLRSGGRLCYWVELRKN